MSNTKSSIPSARLLVDEPRSIPMGVLAGIVAAIASIPLLFVAFIVAELGEKTLFGKVAGVHVSSLGDMSGGQATLSQIVVAGATGFIGSACAAAIALLLLKRAHRLTFAVVAAAGLSLWLAIVWRWAGQHNPAASFTFNFVVAWLMAMLAVYAATAAVDMKDEVPSRDAAPRLS